MARCEGLEVSIVKLEIVDSTAINMQGEVLYTVGEEKKGWCGCTVYMCVAVLLFCMCLPRFELKHSVEKPICDEEMIKRMSEGTTKKKLIAENYLLGRENGQLKQKIAELQKMMDPEEIEKFVGTKMTDEVEKLKEHNKILKNNLRKANLRLATMQDANNDMVVAVRKAEEDYLLCTKKLSETIAEKRELEREMQEHYERLVAENNRYIKMMNRR